MSNTMTVEDDFYKMFKPAVFAWLNKISKGTNKEMVKTLLSPYGIIYAFDLPKKVSEQFFKEWKTKHP